MGRANSRPATDRGVPRVRIHSLRGLQIVSNKVHCHDIVKKILIITLVLLNCLLLFFVIENWYC